MKRRNFFKNLIASTVGLFAASKPKATKASEKPQWVGLREVCCPNCRHWEVCKGTAAGKEGVCISWHPCWEEETKDTTLRFNQNRIEAWTGEKWVNVFEVDIDDVVFPWDNPAGLKITISEPGLTHIQQRTPLPELPPLLDLHCKFMKESEGPEIIVSPNPDVF